MSARQAALERMKEKKGAQFQEQQDRIRDLSNRTDAIRTIINTTGWDFIVSDVERKLAVLKDELSEIAWFRVFRWLELRSEIRKWKGLFTILKTNELSAVLSARRDQKEG